MTSQHLSAITSFGGELITRTSKMRRGIFLGEGALAENPKIRIFADAPRDVTAVINGGDFPREKHRGPHTWARPWTSFRFWMSVYFFRWFVWLFGVFLCVLMGALSCFMVRIEVGFYSFESGKILMGNC